MKNIKNGVSYFVFFRQEQVASFLKHLTIGNNMVLFNLPCKCTFDYHTYFKDKKIDKRKGFYKILSKIFYRFVPDVKVTKELDTTFSETSNKKFMCIKDFINDIEKTYVIGTMGFSPSTIRYILEYLISEKKKYKILVISFNSHITKNHFYYNLQNEQIMGNIVI